MKQTLSRWAGMVRSRLSYIGRRVQWVRAPATGFKAKAWTNGLTTVKIQLISGSAQAYYKKRGDSTKHILTNRPCSIKDAEFIAKMYMYHGIRVSACPLKVQTENGVEFRSVSLGRLRRFVQQSDKDADDAYIEFLSAADNGRLPEPQ